MSSQKPGYLSWIDRQKKKFHRSKKSESAEKSETEATKGTVPTKTEYTIEATRRTVEIISGVVGLVGIPLVKEVLDIGLSLIKTCETINEVQGRVSELKNRVAAFLLVIAKVAKDLEDNGLLKTSGSLVEDLQDLKTCLLSITTRLEAIGKQNILLTTLLPDANLQTIQECVNCFQDAIDRFHTLRDIYAAQDLSKIQNELEETYGLTKVVARKVDSIEIGVREVKSSVDELRAMLEQNGADTGLLIATTRMPSAPGIFFGRDTIVARLAESLSSAETRRPRICILGPGGMGKTSTALAVMNHTAIKAKFSSRNLVWVPCVSLTSPSALIAYLARRFGTAGHPDPLEAMCTILETDSNPYIILFDNFETPWHPLDGEQALTRTILQALDALTNVSILVTMRSEFPPFPHWQAERLNILTLEDSRRVYTTIRQREHRNDDLDPLLEAIGRLPYAITLVATQAKYASASPSQMLNEWRALGSEMLTDVEDNSKSMDSSIELSVKSKYVTKSTGAMELLQVLSMLPGGVYQDDISVWMKSWRLSALSTLRNAALVVARELVIDGAEKTHLLVLPVVQSYMQRLYIPRTIRSSIQESCIHFLSTHQSMIDGPNNPQYKIDKPAITAQEVNLQAIVTEILQDLQASSTSKQGLMASSTQLDALVAFAFYQNWTRPRLDIAEQVLEAAERAQSPLHTAESLYCLAQQQYILSNNLPTAIARFENARDLYLSLDLPLKGCQSDYPILFCIQDAKVQSGSHDKLLALSAAMRSRWEPYFEEYPIIHGLVTCWAAHLAWLLSPAEGPDPHILKDLLEARDIFASYQRLEDLRNCQLLLVRYYLGEEKFEEARAIVEQAFELTTEESLPPQPFFHLCLARCMKGMNEWGPRLYAVLQEGLAAAQKAYIREQDWSAARLAYENILQESRKASPGWSINDIIDRTRNNLLYVEKKVKGDDSGNYQHPLKW